MVSYNTKFVINSSLTLQRLHRRIFTILFLGAQTQLNGWNMPTINFKIVTFLTTVLEGNSTLHKFSIFAFRSYFCVANIPRVDRLDRACHTAVRLRRILTNYDTLCNLRLRRGYPRRVPISKMGNGTKRASVTVATREAR